MNDNPFISVIVPAFNEEMNIYRCLNSLSKLQYQSSMHEIIVVDNGSTDNTVNISKKFTKNVYICPNVNISCLRNYGASIAKGNYYAFIDADCEADAEWLSNAVKILKHKICITGSKVSIPQNNNWIERVWYGNKNNGINDVKYINSGNIIIPSSVFKILGGFNDKLITGEDYEFCMRAKSITKIIEEPDIKVYHHGNPKNIVQFFKREMWHGLGAFGAIKIKLFDKPLIATFIFIVISLMQALSLFIFIFKSEAMPLLIIFSAAILFLFIIAVYSWKHRWNVLNIVKLMLLYYLYLLARSISLFLLMFKIRLRRHR